MFVGIIVSCLAMFISFNLGRVWALLSIVRQLPEEIDFHFEINYFGKTRIISIEQEDKQ
jgi:hypothetical protein